MTASIIKLDTTAEDHHIARMAAVALGLTILENAIPSPLPGVKPGLANIVTLIVLARYGWRTAAWVTLLRGGGQPAVRQLPHAGFLPQPVRCDMQPAGAGLCTAPAVTLVWPGQQ